MRKLFLMIFTILLSTSIKAEIKTADQNKRRLVNPKVERARGSLVAFCPPRNEQTKAALKKQYLRRGNCPSGIAPLMMRAFGFPGDKITVRRRNLYVNDRPVTRYPLENELAPAWFSSNRVIRLGKDEYVVIGSDIESFDSKYFGPISIHSIIGLVIPTRPASCKLPRYRGQTL